MSIEKFKAIVKICIYSVLTICHLVRSKALCCILFCARF